ncbi:hypothetical protein TNCT1_13810 [Streptomyces sp. 1-11]|nr:hypothetical protein TNCT1_13810 [Streptomyces sp. 1-11]
MTGLSYVRMNASQVTVSKVSIPAPNFTEPRRSEGPFGWSRHAVGSGMGGRPCARAWTGGRARGDP